MTVDWEVSRKIKSYLDIGRFRKLLDLCLYIRRHCTFKYVESLLNIVIFIGRRYSALFANFVLQRHTGYFLINVYVPCSLLVAISWVGFWINREATADRIALGKYNSRAD